MKKNIENIVIILFFFLVVLTGIHHEPWVDEAQSWLIARDASFFDIMFNISRYEGTFPLWFLTLKYFIKIGLSYDYIFLVSAIVSTLGIIIFEKKSNLPLYIKILFPFTFWVFYQYTVIARCYSYFLLAFSLLLWIYKDRKNRKIAYLLLLIFFSFISMQGMVISGVLGAFFFWEIVIKENKYKNCVYFIILCMVWLFEVFILLPRDDLYISLNVTSSFLAVIINMISNLFIAKSENLIIIYFNLFAVFFLFLLYINKMTKKLNFPFFMLFVVMSVFNIFIRCVSHHFGIIYYIMVFSIFLNYDEISTEKNVKTSMIILLGLYIILNGICMYNDFTMNYSGAKEMAYYIKQLDYNNKKIYGLGYKCTAILPYYDKNIFMNRQNTYYEWSTNNNEWFIFNNLNDYTPDQIFADKPDYIILEDHNLSTKTIEIYKSIIENMDEYDLKYETKGTLFFKNFYNEDEGFYIYEKRPKTN